MPDLILLLAVTAVWVGLMDLWWESRKVKFTTKPCSVCGALRVLELPEDAVARWQEGELIQTAFPDLPPDDREQLISGTCPQCWDKLFAEEQ